MPRCIARLSVGTSASGSFADTAMASTRCAISELSTSICPSAVGVVGPLKITSASSSRRFVGALVHGVEEPVAQRFGDDADARARGFVGFALATAGQRGDQQAARKQNSAIQLNPRPALRRAFSVRLLQ